MVKHVCFNGTMYTDDFSSPVPVVGLYIAGVSLVCFLLILCDVWAGFKAKKFWFPCRLFSFNSITLTLISVATKIPVDLTTSMPSVQDQLSKLCGTVFICVTMSFMLSSVATNAEFESYANVTALSIFVVTVVVNICIQLATGVIFTFIPENVIIFVCMMLLLIRFWFTVTIMNGRKVDYIDENKDWIRTGGENMLARLKICYLHSYQSCLQLAASNAPHLADVAIVCLMSSVVLVQAMIRSLGLKDFMFCSGVSDYGWSMWWVVGSQVLTVAVVSLVVGVRWLTKLDPDVVFLEFICPLLVEDPYMQFQNLFSLSPSPRFLVRTFRYFFYFPLYLINFAMTAANFLLQFMICRVLCKCYPFGDGGPDDKNIQDLEFMFTSRNVNFDSWVLKKAVEDLEKWIKINKRYAVTHVTSLLSTVPPSGISTSHINTDPGGIIFNSLSMILIAKVMMKSTPTSQSHISNVLGEVFEIIQYIESSLQEGSSKDRRESALAKSIHKYGVRSGQNKHLLQHVLDPDYPFPETRTSLECLCGCLTLISDDSLNDTIDSINSFIYPSEASLENQPRVSIYSINDFNHPSESGNYIEQRPHASNDSDIENRSHASSEVVYGHLEQLFVDMIHAFLAELPVAVYTHILESPVEEIHDRVRLGLGYICKLEPLESLIRFSLPLECNITSLFIEEAELNPAQGQSTDVPTTIPVDEQMEIQIL